MTDQKVRETYFTVVERLSFSDFDIKLCGSDDDHISITTLKTQPANSGYYKIGKMYKIREITEGRIRRVDAIWEVDPSNAPEKLRKEAAQALMENL